MKIFAAYQEIKDPDQQNDGNNSIQMKPRSPEEILETIRYRTPDQIPNPETLEKMVLIDGDIYEEVIVQFEFKEIPSSYSSEVLGIRGMVPNPKFEECEYEPFILAGEIVLRKITK